MTEPFTCQVPLSDGVKPSTELGRLLSPSPNHRLEALRLQGLLNESSASIQAAYLASALDKLSSPYEPGALDEAPADATAMNEIEVVSRGFSGSSCGFTTITVRGKVFESKPDTVPSERGHNIVVLSPNFEVLESRSFDTPNGSSEGERMADFIDNIEQGSIVLIAVNYGPNNNLTGRAHTALKSVGAINTEGLLQAGNFCLIGCKGAKSGSVPQLSASPDKPSVLRRRIPSMPIPLRVGFNTETLHRLTQMICDIASSSFGFVNSGGICAALCCAVLCCAVLCCAALHCTVL